MKRSQRKITRGLAYALATLVLLGCAFALLGEAVSRLGWQKATLIDIWLEWAAIAIAAPEIMLLTWGAH